MFIHGLQPFVILRKHNSVGNGFDVDILQNSGQIIRHFQPSIEIDRVDDYVSIVSNFGFVGSCLFDRVIRFVIILGWPSSTASRHQAYCDEQRKAANQNVFFHRDSYLVDVSFKVIRFRKDIQLFLILHPDAEKRGCLIPNNTVSVLQV